MLRQLAVFLSALDAACADYVLSETLDRDYWIGTASQWGSITDVENLIDTSVAPTGTDYLADGVEGQSWLPGSGYEDFGGDNYGQRGRAFLVPPQTSSYTFWVWADDSAELWLSTDSTDANKLKIADMPSSAAPGEFSHHPSQKSSPVSLVAGNFYYMEILMHEGGVSSGCVVAWHTDPNHSPTIPADLIPPSVMSSYLKGVAFAEAYGLTNTMDREYWIGLSGSGITALTGNGNYPNNPHGSDRIGQGGQLPYWGTGFYPSDTGTYVRGYLVPQTTADYRFTVNSNDYAIFRLSNNSDPSYAKEICRQDSAAANHYQYGTDEEKSPPQTLQAGHVYYIELVQLNTLGWGYYNVAWRTDDAVPSQSDIIPPAVLHAYSRGAPTTTSTTSSTSATSTTSSTSTSSTATSTTSTSSSTTATSTTTSTSTVSSTTSTSTSSTSTSTTTSTSTMSSTTSTSSSSTRTTSSTTSSSSSSTLTTSSSSSTTLTSTSSSSTTTSTSTATTTTSSSISTTSTSTASSTTSTSSSSTSSSSTTASSTTSVTTTVTTSSSSTSTTSKTTSTSSSVTLTSTVSSTTSASTSTTSSSTMTMTSTTSSTWSSSTSTTSTRTMTITTTTSSTMSSSTASTSTRTMTSSTMSSSTISTSTVSSSTTSTSTNTVMRTTSTSSSVTMTSTTSLTMTMTMTMTTTSGTSSSMSSSSSTRSTAINTVSSTTTISSTISMTSTFVSSTSSTMTTPSSSNSSGTSSTTTTSSTRSRTTTRTATSATATTSTVASPLSSSTSTNTTSTSSSTGTTTGSTSTTTSATTSTKTTTTKTTAALTAEASADVKKVTEFLNSITSGAANLAAKLSESNETTLTVSVPGGVLSSSKFSSLVEPDAARIQVDVVAAGIEVSLPLEVLDVFATAGLAVEDVVFSVAVIDPTNEGSSLSGLDGQTVEGGTQSTVEAVMHLELTGPDGLPLKVEKLSEPIEFTMQANYTERSTCVFWDEDLGQWSDEGVSVSPKSQPGELIICLTEHLSLFGSLLKGALNALLCSQFSLLNAEAIGHMVKGDWFSLQGAVMYWWTLAAFVAALLIAIGLDIYRGSLGQYRSAEFFLHVQPAVSDAADSMQEDTEDLSEVSSDEPLRGVICWAACCCLGCLGTVCACFHQTAARDALDEICSNWFDQFSEVRTLLEALWDGLELASLSAGRLFQLSHSVMCRLTTVSSRRLTGASLGFSDEMVAFLLEDEDVLELLMRRYHKRGDDVEARARSMVLAEASQSAGEEPEPRPRWWTSADHEEAWYMLHQEVVEDIRSHVGNHSMCNLPCLVWRIFLLHNPLGLIFCHDLFFSCKLRWLFHAMEVNGSLLVSCIFFQASGSVRGKPTGGDSSEEDGCGGDEDEEDIAFLIGRALVVGIMAVFLAGLPVMFVQSLHTRSLKCFEQQGDSAWNRQLRVWFLQDAVIWVVGTAYLAFSTFFVLLFVANISEEDHEEFVQVGLTCFIQNLLVLPLATAVTLPAFASLLLFVNGAIIGDRSALVRDIHCDLHSNTNVMLPIERV